MTSNEQSQLSGEPREGPGQRLEQEIESRDVFSDSETFIIRLGFITRTPLSCSQFGTGWGGKRQLEKKKKAKDLILADQLDSHALGPRGIFISIPSGTQGDLVSGLRFKVSYCLTGTI